MSKGQRSHVSSGRNARIVRAYEKGEGVVRLRRLRAADRNGQVVAWQARPLLDIGHKARRGALTDREAVGEGRAAGLLLLLLHLLFSRGDCVRCVLCFGVRLLLRDPCTFQIWNHCVLNVAAQGPVWP